MADVARRHGVKLARSLALEDALRLELLMFPRYYLGVNVALILRRPEMLIVVRFHQRLTLAARLQEASLLVGARLFLGALLARLGCAKRLLLRRCNYRLLLRTQRRVSFGDLLDLVLGRLQVNYLAR